MEEREGERQFRRVRFDRREGDSGERVGNTNRLGEKIPRMKQMRRDCGEKTEEKRHGSRDRGEETVTVSDSGDDMVGKDHRGRDSSVRNGVKETVRKSKWNRENDDRSNGKAREEGVLAKYKMHEARVRKNQSWEDVKVGRRR